jgi:hypothetical protein
MYRVIARALKDGLTKSNDSFVTFQGFDGNHDEHYGLANFWISQPGSWDEHSKQIRSIRTPKGRFLAIVGC